MIKNLKFKFILPLLITVGIFLLSYVASLEVSPDIWCNLTISCSSTEFCEYNNPTSVIKQTMNTWSNLAYLLVGLMWIGYGIHDMKTPLNERNNILKRFPLFSIASGFWLIYLFCGSFLYHASGAVIFQKLDLSGVVAATLIPLMFAVFRLISLYNYRMSKNLIYLSKGFILTITFFLNAFFLAYDIPSRDFFLILLNITVSLILFTYLVFRIKVTFKYFIIALILLIFSFITWIFDHSDAVCNPDSILQWHAVWHVCTAASLFFLSLFFRSEVIPHE